MPVPFSFYLTRLCPSTVSSSRQRHFSHPAFSSKKKLGEERTGTEAAKLFTEPQTDSDPHASTSLVTSKWPENPLAKCSFFSFLVLVQQRATTCCSVSPDTAPCSGEPRAQPRWCSVRVSTTPLLLSACCDKIRATAQKRNVKKKTTKNPNPVTMAEAKAANQGRRGGREGGGVTTPRPGGGRRRAQPSAGMVTS